MSNLLGPRDANGIPVPMTVDESIASMKAPQQQGMGSDQVRLPVYDSIRHSGTDYRSCDRCPVSKSVNVSLERSYVSWHSMM